MSCQAIKKEAWLQKKVEGYNSHGGLGREGMRYAEERYRQQLLHNFLDTVYDVVFNLRFICSHRCAVDIPAQSNRVKVHDIKMSVGRVI
jgi:hypothetical protein